MEGHSLIKFSDSIYSLSLPNLYFPAAATAVTTTIPTHTKTEEQGSSTLVIVIR